MNNMYDSVTRLKEIFDEVDSRIAAMDSLTKAVHDSAVLSNSWPIYSKVNFDGQIAWADVEYYL